MLFNFGKCKCLHTGHGTVYNGWYCTKYYFKGKGLNLNSSANMKVSEQCGIAAAKGNQIIELIRRNIV